MKYSNLVLCDCGIHISKNIIEKHLKTKLHKRQLLKGSLPRGRPWPKKK